ncbi:MAG: hypothetical protein A2046_07300 [Bacteroidetes bacterium GWA2_30_7]|nr:MAG: hypothetical protein A2046_07300 [Bacteroidetes bacterium GWA2_30_7]
MKTLTVILIIIPIYIIISFFCFSTDENSTDLEYNKEFNSKYNVFSIPIPDKLDFAGENVPLKLFDVRESLDRELHVNTYWQSQTMFYLKKANRYFPIMEPILKRNNIPDDFKYLAVIESGLSNVTSPSGAKGVWQFLPNTAKEFGLEVNDEVDERYHLEKSTQAACKYLNEAYKIFKNWTLVAASYNVGMTSLTNSLKNQRVDNYYDLLLNEETARYPYRIISIKLIMSQPNNYGFHFRKKDLYSNIPSDIVKIDSSIQDLTNFAFLNKINYKILKLFNPWLRQNILTNKDKKTYEIKIPKEGFREIIINEIEYNEIFSPEENKTIISDSISNIENIQN